MAWCSAAVSPTPLKPMKRVLPAFLSFSSAGATSFSAMSIGELVAGVLGDQRIVQLEEIDMIAAHAGKAVVHALLDRLAGIGAMLGRQPHLGADDNVGLECLQYAAEFFSNSPLP